RARARARCKIFHYCRNVASPAGSLGQTGGQEPDLGNMTASTTWLHEGDIVFLASDGVTDNFDPSILKLAKPPAPHLKSESLTLEVRLYRCSAV
ncbi:hypothetical protein DUNSADRAFT_4357, partial [Dunaliella salina]